MSECFQQISDPDIGTLSEVLDPIGLVKHLRESYLFSGIGGTTEEVQVRVLRHHLRQRCTLEIGMRSGKGWHTVIGKVFHDDRFDLFQAMEGIRQAGFGAQDEFSIPQPLAYLQTLRLFVQEKVEGPLAKEIFITGDDWSRAAAAERCAMWLARFHALAPKAGLVFDSSRYLDVLRDRTRRIGKLGGRCAEKSARLLRRLEDAAALLTPVKMRAGHGSYSPAQIVLAEGRTVVFDWDGYDVADPARDVARFFHATRRLALDQLGCIGALDGSAEIFRETYFATGDPEVKTNLWFYEAAACLKLARTVPRWQEKSEQFLDEGLRILDRETLR
ncbi:MAG TPA: phosphotransferase [Candidatus Acidoferrales bacterium]|nr:phosphotransferase [Candidatus Acidoferrales bacterium]